MRSLALQKMKLQSVPNEIQHLTLLQELSLSDNQITECLKKIRLQMIEPIYEGIHNFVDGILYQPIDM